MSVRARLDALRGRIHSACRNSGRSPDEVRLVAVSKKQPDDYLFQALEAGQLDFGENYLQELKRKQALLPNAHFHMIGHVQTNKAKLAAEAHLVHTLDSVRLARALQKAVEPGQRLGVLVEVNVGVEPQKAGVAPSQVAALVDEIRSMERLDVRGLMCIPPPGQGRRFFAELRSLAETLRKQTGMALPDLSMGMSADFEDAIGEGATIVRVGTAVFGPRPLPGPP